MAEEEIVLTELVDPAAGGLAVPALESDDHLLLEDIRNVRFRISADLGRSVLKVHEILALRVGSVVTLRKMAGELTDIRANGLSLARGEVVVINDMLHVRISEIIDSDESKKDDDV